MSGVLFYIGEASLVRRGCLHHGSRTLGLVVTGVVACCNIAGLVFGPVVIFFVNFGLVGCAGGSVGGRAGGPLRSAATQSKRGRVLAKLTEEAVSFEVSHE